MTPEQQALYGTSTPSYDQAYDQSYYDTGYQTGPTDPGYEGPYKEDTLDTEAAAKGPVFGATRYDDDSEPAERPKLAPPPKLPPPPKVAPPPKSPPKKKTFARPELAHSPEQAPAHCPVCGLDVDYENLICPECGGKLY